MMKPHAVFEFNTICLIFGIVPIFWPVWLNSFLFESTYPFSHYQMYFFILQYFSFLIDFASIFTLFCSWNLEVLTHSYFFYENLENLVLRDFCSRQNFCILCHQSSLTMVMKHTRTAYFQLISYSNWNYYQMFSILNLIMMICSSEVYPFFLPNISWLKPADLILHFDVGLAHVAFSSFHPSISYVIVFLWAWLFPSRFFEVCSCRSCCAWSSCL